MLRESMLMRLSSGCTLATTTVVIVLYAALGGCSHSGHGPIAAAHHDTVGRIAHYLDDEIHGEGGVPVNVCTNPPYCNSPKVVASGDDFTVQVEAIAPGNEWYFISYAGPLVDDAIAGPRGMVYLRFRTVRQDGGVAYIADFDVETNPGFAGHYAVGVSRYSTTAAGAFDLMLP